MLHIFTFLTDESRIQYLKKTAEGNDVEVHYIKNDTWNGYVDKIIAVNRAMESLQEEDIVCFIDAYDVLVNHEISTILNGFFSYDCDLLLGAELACYPTRYQDRFPLTRSNHRFLNSGGYIGYKHAIRDILEWKPLSEIHKICAYGGDQTYFIEYFLNFYLEKKIRLDDRCLVFQNMHWVNWKELEFVEGRMYNTVMKTFPCFIHFNGGTWQQDNKENIMPVFVEKMRKAEISRQNLDGYSQIINKTCYPHPQL